jgi:hypothetical protein
MRIDDVLFEGISPIVYHYTNLKHLYNILHNNRIELSPGGFTKDVETEKGKGGYFLSTARTRTGSFHATKDVGALIKLDGRKLSSNLPGKAMDYYPSNMRQYNPKGFEQEDRIFSHNPTIDNIQKYILRIDILIPSKDNDLAQKYKQLAYAAYSYGKKNNIDVNIYADRKNFITGSHNTISFEDIKKLNTRRKDSREDTRRQLTSKEIEELSFIYKALAFDDFKKLSSNEQKFMKDYLRYFEAEKQNPAGLVTTLHNVTSAPKARNLLHKIYGKMRGYGIQDINPQKITKAIYIKWKHLLGAV